tara:strand:- start:906 stop:1409 length:504 start_codon:yes stop_codon:yes gene_type:complete
MAIIGDKLRDLISKELDNNAKKVDHDCDCIVKDIRNGKDQGRNIQKTLKFIADVAKVVATITIFLKTVKSIQETIEASKKAAQAARKAGVIGSALNPAAAAVGVAQEMIIKKVEEEEEDIKAAVNVTDPAIQTFTNTLTRNKDKISKALADKAQSDAVAADMKNMLN